MIVALWKHHVSWFPGATRNDSKIHVTASLKKKKRAKEKLEDQLLSDYTEKKPTLGYV